MKTNYSVIVENARKEALGCGDPQVHLMENRTLDAIVKSVITDVDQSAELAQERKHRVDAYRLQNLLRMTEISSVELDGEYCFFGHQAIARKADGTKVQSLLESIDLAIAQFQAECSPHEPQGDPDCIHLDICGKCGAVV